MPSRNRTGWNKITIKKIDKIKTVLKRSVIVCDNV